MFDTTHRHTNRAQGIAGKGTLAVVLAVCALCWGECFRLSVGYPIAEDAEAAPLWNAICRLLPDKAAAYAIGMLLMLGGAYLLHRASYALVLIREKTMLPFAFYVLLVSTNPSFLPLKATSVGAFCLTLAFYELLSAYHDPEARSNAFNVGLLLGVGSLLWMHILLFLPVFWIGMYIFLSLNVRTVAATLVGVATVYWLLLGWCFATGDYAQFDYALSGFRFSLLTASDVSSATWIEISVAAMLTLIAIANIFIHEYDNSRRTRHYLSFTTTLAIWSFSLYFVFDHEAEEFLLAACGPVAVLTAHFFTTVRGWIITCLFWAIVVLYVALLFLRLWSFL